MATLIPVISITDFKKLKAHELKELKSCEVMSDGDYLFTFVNAPTNYIRVQVEYLSELGNAGFGKTLEEIKQYATV